MTRIEKQAAAGAAVLEDPQEFFTHGEGDSPRTHVARPTRASVLGLAVALTLGFSAIELVGGGGPTPSPSSATRAT